MDLKKLEQAARLIIEAVGDDPDREGLRETPKRFADMMAEQFAYTAVSNEDIAREFEKTFATPENDMVVVKDIPIFSHCEHHIALMYNMKAAVGYIPHGRVIGLSKSPALPTPYPSGSRFRNASAPISGTSWKWSPTLPM